MESGECVLTSLNSIWMPKGQFLSYASTLACRFNNETIIAQFHECLLRMQPNPNA
jgi:hypothetical protein